jgi:hypothetical protein
MNTLASNQSYRVDPADESWVYSLCSQPDYSLNCISTRNILSTTKRIWETLYKFFKVTFQWDRRIEQIKKYQNSFPLRIFAKNDKEKIWSLLWLTG